MSNHLKPITDNDLHAYVDGELDVQRRNEIEAWLESNPDGAARIRSYREIGNRLHTHFDSILDEPAKLAVPVIETSLFNLARVAAVAGLMVLSGLFGWQFDKLRSTVPTPTIVNLVQPASFAHRVYATDTDYPVEISAANQALLNNWVMRRMHTQLKAPNLTIEGLKLVGGRLLPSTNRMAVQFMYEDQQGQRVTVYVRRISDHKQGVDFKYKEQGDLHVYYWTNDQMGYAVTGEQSELSLISIASAVQASFRQPTS